MDHLEKKKTFKNTAFLMSCVNSSSMKAPCSSREEVQRTATVVPFFYPSVGLEPSPSGLLARVVPTAPSVNEPRGPRGVSSASAPAQDGGRAWLLLPFANRERLAGVQGAAMSPLVVGTRPAKSWQEAPAVVSRRLANHLMIQLAYPAVGHRGHHHALGLATPKQTRRQLRPRRICSNQAMGGFDYGRT